MSATRLKAQKILSRCFSRAEFEFLQLQPKFIEATRQLETIEDALNTVYLGEHLIQQTWKESDARLTPELSQVIHDASRDGQLEISGRAVVQ